MSTGLPAPPQWLLFDLGGVLMNFSGVEELSALTGLSEQQVGHKLLDCSCLRLFEMGELAPHEFAERFVDEMDLQTTPADTLLRWANYEAGPKAGALDYLKELSQRWNLACLSNTSITHWERLRDRHGIAELFRHCILSFEVGLHKPDPAIFLHATATIGSEPENVIYFDDRTDNVSTAERLGMRAFEVTSPQEIRKILRGLMIH